MSPNDLDPLVYGPSGPPPAASLTWFDALACLLWVAAGAMLGAMLGYWRGRREKAS